MKVLNTEELNRQQTYKHVKRFFDLDKSRSGRNSRFSKVAQLSQEQRAMLKGILKSIKTVSKELKQIAPSRSK